MGWFFVLILHMFGLLRPLIGLAFGLFALFVALFLAYWIIRFLWTNGPAIGLFLLFCYLGFAGISGVVYLLIKYPPIPVAILTGYLAYRSHERAAKEAEEFINSQPPGATRAKPKRR